MSIWNLNVNCGITFGEDSRLTVGEKLKSYGATTALLLYDMAMDQFGYQREIEKVINDANIIRIIHALETLYFVRSLHFRPLPVPELS